MASELSDLEDKYQALEKTFNSENEYIVVFLDYELEKARACVKKYELSTLNDAVAQKANCEADVSRLQSDRSIRETRINSIKSEMDSLALQINRLKPSGATSASGGSTSQSGASSTVQTDTTKNPSSPQATQAPSSPEPVAKEQEPESAAPLPTATPSPTTSQKPSSVSQGLPSTTAKVTPSPKPIVKKRTITCIKGKTIRKVTAVKPVCPKGFRIKR